MQNSKDKTGYLFATKYKRHAPGTVAHSMFENLTGGINVPPALLTEGGQNMKAPVLRSCQ